MKLTMMMVSGEEGSTKSAEKEKAQKSVAKDYCPMINATSGLKQRDYEIISFRSMVVW